MSPCILIYYRRSPKKVVIFCQFLLFLFILQNLNLLILVFIAGWSDERKWCEKVLIAHAGIDECMRRGLYYIVSRALQKNNIYSWTVQVYLRREEARYRKSESISKIMKRLFDILVSLFFRKHYYLSCLVQEKRRFW